MERYKNKVKYWMTFDEINNRKNTADGIFTWTCSGVLFKKRENREEVMYQAVHHELVASALVVKAGHEINPDFKIGCTVFFTPIYPFSYNDNDIMLHVDRYFFADVHSRGYIPCDIALTILSISN